MREQILKDLQGNKIKLEAVPCIQFFQRFPRPTPKKAFFADPMYGGNKNMVGRKMWAFLARAPTTWTGPASSNVASPLWPRVDLWGKGLTIMAIKKDKVDAIPVGFGWTGAISAKS